MNKKPHLFCVLCECKNAGNMGAVARAIKNMELDGLILVRPNRERWLEAIKMAPDAEDILEEAKIYSSLEQAISNMHFVIGTTRRIRKHRIRSFGPRETIQEVINLHPSHRVAMVFGSERTGLSNHELSFCQKIIVIPTSMKLPSINLAQAVMIIAYEWHMSCRRESEISIDKKISLASAEKRHNLITHAEEILRRIGFMQQDSDHIKLSIIDMLSRLDLTDRDIAILRGILSRIEYCLNKQNG